MAPGDEVVLFGPGDDGEPTAQDWAEALGTISYEVVTGSPRGWRGPTVSREREFYLAGTGLASRWPADALHRLAEGSAVSLTVSTADQMRELGRRLASAVAPGDLVILSGGLGAGKTTLTKGIGDELGVRGPITSPTFVIARVHLPVGSAPAGPGRRSPMPTPTGSAAGSSSTISTSTPTSRRR